VQRPCRAAGEPSNAGDEMTNPQRDVPASVFRAFLLSVLLYGGPILAILLVLPLEQVTNLGGFLDAIKSVFTVWGGSVSPGGTPTLTGFGLFLGWVSAVAVILGVLSSATSWLMGANRAYAVAALDGSAPRILGRLSKRSGTPIAVNLLTGVLATIIMLLASLVVGADSNRYFVAVLGLAISTTTISYLGVFPALVKLRYAQPDVQRPYRVPFGIVGVWVASILTTFWALLATVSLVWPGFGVGWFGTQGSPAEVLADIGFAGERLLYELTQIVPLVVVLVFGLVFYQLGASTRKRQVEVPLPSKPAPCNLQETSDERRIPPRRCTEPAPSPPSRREGAQAQARAGDAPWVAWGADDGGGVRRRHRAGHRHARGGARPRRAPGGDGPEVRAAVLLRREAWAMAGL